MSLHYPWLFTLVCSSTLLSYFVTNRFNLILAFPSIQTEDEGRMFFHSDMISSTMLYADNAHTGLMDFGMLKENQYDYDDAQNKIPFNELYNRIELRYTNYSAPFKQGMEYVRTGDIVSYDASTDASDILLMMGGSSNHVVTVLSCILSFVYAFPNSPLLYIDFGVTPQERCWLEYVFRMVHTLHDKRNASVPIYYRTVDWDHFPDWIHITKGLNHGGYAWKPIVIADAFYQWKGVVMWNDAGNYFREACIGGIMAMRKEGIYMPYDPSRLDFKFHNDAYRFMVQYHFTKPFNRTVTSGRAIYMLFDYHNSVCRDRIMIPWVQCAYTRRCMTLKGAAKTSHLPEQGVLSILMRENNITLSLSRYMNYYPFIRRDKKEYLTVIPNPQLQSDIELYNEMNKKEYSQQDMLHMCPVL